MKILFISDIHLGARYVTDHRAHEARIVDFLRREGSAADHIYLLGDILDYWFEYRDVVPRGYIRFFGELAALSDAGVGITWLTGNHDIWLFDYLRDELRIEVVDAPYISREIGDSRFILAHGDRIGHASAGFRFICSVFRNRICQKLYAALHPRITVPFAKAWSDSSRSGKGEATETQRDNHIKILIGDADRLALDNPGTDIAVMGHHHIPLDTHLPQSGARLIVLGDWIDKDPYAVYDGKDISLRKYVPTEVINE